MKPCPSCLQDNPDAAVACDFCGFRFDRPLPLEKTRLLEAEVESLAPGDVVNDRYTVLRELGRSGVGVVYLATDAYAFDREVVLEFIHPRLVENPEAGKRFVMEVLTCQQLNSDHIVRVHDLERRGQLQFFSMEYIGGRSLRELIDDRKAKRPPLHSERGASYPKPGPGSPGLRPPIHHPPGHFAREHHGHR